MNIAKHYCTQCTGRTCRLYQYVRDGVLYSPLRCPYSDGGDDASEWANGVGPDEYSEYEDYVTLREETALTDAVLLGTLIRNTASGLSTTMYSRLKKKAGYYVLWFEAAGRPDQIAIFKETVILICEKYRNDRQLPQTEDR